MYVCASLNVPRQVLCPRRLELLLDAYFGRRVFSVSTLVKLRTIRPFVQVVGVPGQCNIFFWQFEESRRLTILWCMVDVYNCNRRSVWSIQRTLATTQCSARHYHNSGAQWWVLVGTVPVLRQQYGIALYCFANGLIDTRYVWWCRAGDHFPWLVLFDDFSKIRPSDDGNKHNRNHAWWVTKRRS